MIDVRPTTPEGVVDLIAARANASPERLRIAIDGAPAAAPHDLAALVAVRLAPRPTLQVRADSFWKQASLRLERGRANPDAWLDDWLDEAALRREVLVDFPATGTALPALRDPDADRSIRAARVTLPPDGIVILSGSVLLGRGLPFDTSVHLWLSSAARARRTPPDEAWTLPALERYDLERNPVGVADLVVRSDDPRHPAVVVP